MSYNLIVRLNEGGTWKTVEGGLTAKWTKYQDANSCLKWQGRLDSNKILNPEVIQVICVSDAKLAEMSNGAPAKTQETKQVMEIVTVPPPSSIVPVGISDGPGLVVGGIVTLVVVGVVLTLTKWLGKDWSK